MNDFCHTSLSSSKPLLNSWCHSFSSLTRIGLSIFQNKWCCIGLNTVRFLTWWRKRPIKLHLSTPTDMINHLTSDPTYCILCENSTSGCLRVMHEKIPSTRKHISQNTQRWPESILSVIIFLQGTHDNKHVMSLSFHFWHQQCLVFNCHLTP